jgi:OMF family outer membrane factor
MKLVNIHKLAWLFLLLAAAVHALPAQVWTLEQCVDTAQVHNQHLQMGRNAMALSAEKQREAKAQRIPKVAVQADYKYFTHLPYQLLPLSVFGGPEGQFREAQFGVPHTINANLQVGMPLYNPQLRGAVEATGIAGELSDLQYEKSREQVFFEIANLYYNAQILHHQLTFAEGNLTNANRLLENMRLLREQLLARATDVSKVELQVAQLTTLKESLGSKYEQVLNALKFAMGLSLDREVQIDPDISYAPAAAYAPLPSLDIRLAQTRGRLLSSELQTLKNSRLPTVSLFGSFGTTGFGYDQSPNEFLNFYALGFAGVQVSYPLFNGTITKLKMDQKRLELQTNDLQMSLLSGQNTLQVRNATLQRAIAQNAVQTTSEQTRLAETIYEQTLLQKKQGTATLTDVLLADNALREAQQSWLNAVIDYLKADLELKKFTGHISSIQ